MGFVHFLIELLKDPRTIIAQWIAMGVAPTLGFIFLIVFLFPILSVALVSGFGFVVWILQMIFGPPGPSN